MAHWRYCPFSSLECFYSIPEGDLLRKLLAGALGVVLLLSACSHTDEEVMRVNDTVFHLSDVEALYESGRAEIDDDFREVLRLLLVNEIFSTALADDFGLEVSESDVEEIYQAATAAIATAGMTAEDYMGLAGVGDGFIHLMAELEVVNTLVPDAITVLLSEPERVTEVFADPALITNVCVRHILVETEEEAEDVIDRLDAGEDFAVVSDEVSIDTQSVANGGDLGCTFASVNVQPFAEATLAAEIDEIYGPVETEFGFHVLEVYERSAPTEEEYLEDPVASVDTSYSNEVFTEWVDQVYGSADVEVDQRFGTWNGSQIVASGQ